jgi:hypothetical protein
MDWNEQQLKDLMTSFHSRYLILYPNLLSKDLSELAGSPALQSLRTGKHVPWLRLAVAANDVQIYECEVCSNNGS